MKQQTFPSGYVVSIDVVAAFFLGLLNGYNKAPLLNSVSGYKTIFSHFFWIYIMTKPLETYRQGDVMLIRVAKAPKTAKKQAVKDRIVLAYGEVTGHAHAIHDLDQAELLVEEKNKTSYVSAKGKLFLTHEEHDAIEIPKGVYEVRRQREFAPEANHFVHD